MESLGRVSDPGGSGPPAPGAIPAGGTRAGPAEGAGGRTPWEQTALSPGEAGAGINCGGGPARGGGGGAAPPERHLTVLPPPPPPPAPPLGGGPANPLRERKLIAAAGEGRIKASVDPHPPGLESCYLLLN